MLPTLLTDTPIMAAAKGESAIGRMARYRAAGCKLERDRATLIAAIESVYKFCPVRVQDQLQTTLNKVQS